MTDQFNKPEYTKRRLRVFSSADAIVREREEVDALGREAFDKTSTAMWSGDAAEAAQLRREYRRRKNALWGQYKRLRDVEYAEAKASAERFLAFAAETGSEGQEVDTLQKQINWMEENLKRALRAASF